MVKAGARMRTGGVGRAWPRGARAGGFARTGAALAMGLAAATFAAAGDWPQWRFDAGRTACSPDPLPAELHLQWRRELPRPVPAWRDEPGMQFDAAYQPIALGPFLYVASPLNDTLTAYALNTGEEKWRAFTDGPIRVPPAAWRARGGASAGDGAPTNDPPRVFVGGDDGWLRCFHAVDGSPLWAVRPGPTHRRLLGNERLVSAWPVRGGPVVADDTVYCAAGVWAFMGTFVVALDVRTGTERWHCDAASFVWRPLPHPGAEGIAGLAPQGALAVVGDRLIAPGSKLTPGLFERATGRFLGFGIGGGPYVAGRGGAVCAGHLLFEPRRGAPVGYAEFRRGALPVMDTNAWYMVGLAALPPDAAPRVVANGGGSGVLRSVPPPPPPPPQYGDDLRDELGDAPPAPAKTGAVATPAVSVSRALWPLPGRPWLKAGDTLVVGTPAGLELLDASGVADLPTVRGTIPLEEGPGAVLAAHGRLIVATTNGTLLCFGSTRAAPVTHAVKAPPASRAADAAPAAARQARDLLRAGGAKDGYAVVWGLREGGLVDELLRQSDLHVIAADPDAGKVAALRARLDAQGLYGRRAAAFVGEPAEAALPPYLASLIVSEDAESLPAWRAAAAAQESGDAQPGAALLRALAEPLRPYGGTLAMALSRDGARRFAAWVATAGLAEFTAGGGRFATLTRGGPLPGAADWRGQNADAGHSRCGRDERVRAPLGVLWYGNALSNALILPRHGKGPVEQVVGGRLFIEGPDSLSAADVYTGRALWTRAFPGLGQHYDVTRHQDGALVTGANYFAAPDAVYVAVDTRCHVLDPATGATRKTLALPDDSLWQFVLVSGDVLVAGARPIFGDPAPPRRYKGPAFSRGLVAMNRHSGAVLWRRDARESFGHQAIVAGADAVYCLDRMATDTRDALLRRGVTPDDPIRLFALELATGRVLWTEDEEFGRQLSYAADRDLLLLGDTVALPRGATPTLRAARGRDGKPLWRREGIAAAQAMLGPDWLLTQDRAALDVRTGRPRWEADFHGRRRPWTFARAYGCSPVNASRHLLTFRSGSAAFYDLSRDDGTANLAGFRSGCTPSLIVADGVLNAPDYTRTCICAYDNRSSLALVHMPEVEYWAYGRALDADRVALNLGAPGDRRANDGTLWMDFPFAGGPAPDLTVRMSPTNAPAFYEHSSRLVAGEPKWVFASGVEGLERLTVSLAAPTNGVPFWMRRDEPKPATAALLTVRLYFAEPRPVAAGERVFDVAIQDREALRDFDIVAAAGGPRRGVVREFVGIEAARELTVAFTPRTGAPLLCGLEILRARKE